MYIRAYVFIYSAIAVTFIPIGRTYFRKIYFQVHCLKTSLRIVKFYDALRLRSELHVQFSNSLHNRNFYLEGRRPILYKRDKVVTHFNNNFGEG